MLIRVLCTVISILSLAPVDLPAGFAQSQEERQFRGVSMALLNPFISVRGRVRRKRKFRFLYRSCESGCVHNYESADGKPVTLVNACYSGSADDARRNMQKDLIDEGRVIRRSWRRNHRGRRGERIVLVYAKDETGDKPVKIIWYVPGDICFDYIEAGSLRLALDFERSAAATEDWMQ